VLAPFPLDGDDCFELDADARRLAVAAACGSRRDPHTSSDVVPPRKGDTMQIGLVGLGRMGANMSRRWLRDGHTVVGYARHAETCRAARQISPIACSRPWDTASAATKNRRV